MCQPILAVLTTKNAGKPSTFTHAIGCTPTVHKGFDTYHGNPRAPALGKGRQDLTVLSNKMGHLPNGTIDTKVMKSPEQEGAPVAIGVKAQVVQSFITFPLNSMGQLI